MCGLFGFSLTRPVPYLGEWLGMLNDSRGGHSWGYFSLDSNYPEIQRGMGKFFLKNHSLPDMKRMVGHTRWATKGAIVVGNAHPFEIGPITGSHNGMVYNHEVLNTVYERDFDVDSMHIFAHLAEDLSFDEIEGYGSIAWHDERDGELKLCKMLNGDLSVRRLFKGKENIGIAWSSLDSDLAYALKRCKIQSERLQVDEGQVYQVENDGLYLTRNRLDLYEDWKMESSDLLYNKNFLFEENEWDVPQKYWIPDEMKDSQ